VIIPKGDHPNCQHFRNRAHNLIDELSPEYAWEITAKRYKKKRSNAQNKYHWGVVIKTICDETGNDANDMHEHLLGERFGWLDYDVMGIPKRKPARRSSELSTDEFEAFNEWCRAYAATHAGVAVPLPGEVIL